MIEGDIQLKPNCSKARPPKASDSAQRLAIMSYVKKGTEQVK